MAFVSRHQHVRIPRGESMEHQRNANLLKAASAGILSRRGLLQRAGWTVAAAALPSGLFAAESVSPVMAKLSAYMSEAGGRALPDEVVEKAKHHILDTFAAMISGSDLPPARAAFHVRPRLYDRQDRDDRGLENDLEPSGGGVHQRHAGAFR